MVSREDSLKERLEKWEKLSPEERQVGRARRLGLFRQCSGDAIVRTDGLPGNWDIPAEEND